MKPTRCTNFSNLFLEQNSTCFGQFLCPKHVEFYSQNKFEKLVHLVGFNITIYRDARSPEHQFFSGSIFFYYTRIFFKSVLLRLSH